MRVGGKWRIIAMSGLSTDYPDLVEPAYILFKRKGGGELAFDCCTGAIGKAAAPRRLPSTSHGTATARWKTWPTNQSNE